ncbi:hypothetical protein ACFVH6_22170 [Spirillospora sp. NPDC127200]
MARPTTDELDQRVRALNAERLRPDQPHPTVEDLMQRLIATIHAAYLTRPDRDRGRN